MHLKFIYIQTLIFLLIGLFIFKAEECKVLTVLWKKRAWSYCTLQYWLDQWGELGAGFICFFVKRHIQSLLDILQL